MLRSGQTLRCGVDRDVWIALDDTELRLPYPKADFGGSELVVSPDESLAAMFIYSGQSSQGWELFSLAPLRHLGGLPYIHGEGDAPCFSPDGKWIAMFVCVDPMIRGTGEWAEDALDGDDDNLVTVDWARLYLQAVPDGEVTDVPVGTPVPRSTTFEVVQEWRPYGVLAWTADSAVLQLPSSKTLVRPPTTDAITTP